VLGSTDVEGLKGDMSFHVTMSCHKSTTLRQNEQFQQYMVYSMLTAGASPRSLPDMQVEMMALLSETKAEMTTAMRGGHDGVQNEAGSSRHSK